MKRKENLSTKNGIKNYAKSQVTDLSKVIVSPIVAKRLFNEYILQTVQYSHVRCHLLTVKIKYRQRNFIFLTADSDAMINRFHQIRLDILDLISNRPSGSVISLAEVHRLLKSYNVYNYLIS